MHWDGFHIVVGPNAEPLQGVLAVLREQARDQAESATGFTWQSLEQTGYRIMPVDVWERK
jgi:hypothetical protein